MDMDFADLKPSVMSAIIVLLMVIITVPFAKFLAGPGGKVYVPGLTELIGTI